VRYFDEVDQDNKPTRFVCKNCGAEGEHKTIDCPVQIVCVSHVLVTFSLAHLIPEVFDMRCTK
jgi:hypothetical protein